MITLEIVFYLPEVLSTPCGNHLCKNHVDVYATEENMLFNGNMSFRAVVRRLSLGNKL